MGGVPERPDGVLDIIAGEQTWMRRNLVYAVIVPALVLVGILLAWHLRRGAFTWEMVRLRATDRLFLVDRRPLKRSDLSPVSIARSNPAAASFDLEEREKEIRLVLRDAAGRELEARRVRNHDVDFVGVLKRYSEKTGNEADSVRVLYLGRRRASPYLVIYSSDLAPGMGEGEE